MLYTLCVEDPTPRTDAADDRDTAAPPPPASGPTSPAKPLPIKRILLAAVLVSAALSGLVYYRSGRLPSVSLPGLGGSSDAGRAAPVDPYVAAVRKSEEGRGEPVGRKAEIEIPPELKHYAERRRFLAIQVAAWEESRAPIPHDFAELVRQTGEGDRLVLLPMLGRGYVLYGVGLAAPEELTHYDRASRKSVPLFAGEAELTAEQERLNESEKTLKERDAELRTQLRQLPKADRPSRAMLNELIAQAGRELAVVSKRKALVGSFYKTAKGRRLLFDEYATLAERARAFDGRAFDLSDAAGRKEFKARLLGYVSPAARALIEELGVAYEEKFKRPLPVTSLVRTEEYQRQLGEAGNPNATRIDVPPHTTGQAFDIYYGHMTADEQHFVMGELARLERDGRAESLREERDHYHVFAFADGRPPAEETIRSVLRGEPPARREEKKTEAKKAETKKAETKKAETKKAGAKKAGKRSSRK
ncbi:MAG TPA: DUF5715 family protein [Pyrinomonadaceae bacterium]|jgi:hypothetical protein|nr:DUF5715 family protein [Pyrinomonadaceae bacterium]